jgi:hypothetical protein
MLRISRISRPKQNHDHPDWKNWVTGLSDTFILFWTIQLLFFLPFLSNPLQQSAPSDEIQRLWPSAAEERNDGFSYEPDRQTVARV